MGIASNRAETSKADNGAGDRNIAAQPGNENSPDTDSSALGVYALRMKKRKVDKDRSERNQAQCIQLIHGSSFPLQTDWDSLA